MISAVNHLPLLNGNNNMKKIISFLICLFFLKAGFSQDNAMRTYKVGIFAPVYLDSIFNGETYTYYRGFPRFTLQGLDFFQGAMVALDSLKIQNGNVQAYFFDTKSISGDIPTLIANKSMDSLDLIIGSVRDKDYLQLASYSLKKNIPFISATYPNDGGITGNPFTVIVNSTLRAHCEAIFGYLFQAYGNEKIFLLNKEGSQEDRIEGYFKSANEQEGKSLLKLETVRMKDYNFSSLINKLDSTKENIIIGGSLEETFATELISALSKAKNRKCKVIGMPNWDGFASGKKFRDYPVYFTTPYYNNKNDVHSQMLRNAYMQKYKGNPSDMAHKGFEAVYVFVDLLTRFPDSYMSHLNEYGSKIFTDFNFKPVFGNKKKLSPDYFENKHLYFVKAISGNFTVAW